MELWTKTETIKRIRVAAKMARSADYLPKNALIEVQQRTHPEYITSTDEFDRHPDDDLVEFWRISDGCRVMPEQFRGKGYVADIAFSIVDMWGQTLANVITVWLGDDNHEPQLIHVPGRSQERIDQVNSAT